jgi:DNA-binding IclR family transcriptional regulator
MTNGMAADKPADGRTRGSFQVLDRTLAILGLFVAEQPEWSTTQAARTLDLPVPTVHRILSALARHGYVSQDEESRRFRLGRAALMLGLRAGAALDLRSAALPSLRRLALDTGETSLLTGLNPQRDASVCLERVESTQPLRLSVTPGHQLPLHAGASQKALAAYLDDESLERLLSGPLEPLCHNTIIDPAELRAELTRVRSAGFAFSMGETNLDVSGIALPILNEQDGVLCAVGIAGPSARFSAQKVDELAVRTHVAAEEVAQAVGGHVPALATPALKKSKRSTTGRNR